MSKKRLALSSNKIMDLTESMNLRNTDGLMKQDQKSNSCSPQKSASPVLDEVEINQEIGESSSPPVHTSNQFQLINMKNRIDAMREPRTEERRTVFKMDERLLEEDSQFSLR